MINRSNEILIAYYLTKHNGSYSYFNKLSPKSIENIQKICFDLVILMDFKFGAKSENVKEIDKNIVDFYNGHKNLTYTQIRELISQINFE